MPTREATQRARLLVAPTIYPFISLQAALLQWQRGEERPTELDDNILIDVNEETGEEFVSQDKYDEYGRLTHSYIDTKNAPTSLHRTINRIHDFYEQEAVELLLTAVPGLRNILTVSYTDKFVSQVQHCFQNIA